MKSNFETYYQKDLETGWFEVDNIDRCVDKTCVMNKKYAELRLQTRTIHIEEPKDIYRDSRADPFQKVEVHNLLIIILFVAICS